MTDHMGQRPHESRRRHQAVLHRARRRRRQRRQARVRRIRFLRGFRSAQFWGKSAVTLTLLAATVFWAKFGLVYDIPDYAKFGPLSHVQSYVTIKPWWFGPPVFDVASYGPGPNHVVDNTTAYSLLLNKLGKYQDVILIPDFVWASHP
jgi:hypothetical protein